MPDLITVEAFDLESMDADGAIREAEDAVAGTPAPTSSARRPSAAERWWAAACCSRASPALARATPSKKQDVAILNYALTLEYLEAAFYVEAVAKGAISGDALPARSSSATTRSRT